MQCRALGNPAITPSRVLIRFNPVRVFGYGGEVSTLKMIQRYLVLTMDVVQLTYDGYRGMLDKIVRKDFIDETCTFKY